MEPEKSDFPTKVHILFLLAFLLRITGLLNIQIGGDFAEHWMVAGKIVEEGFRPLSGPTASVNHNFYLGPFYYYFLSISYWLGKGNYISAIVFFSFFNSLSIYPLYYISAKWFKTNTILKILVLYTCSSYLIQIQSFPWHPYLLPAFTIWILFLISRLSNNVIRFLPIIFFLCGILLQIHATALLLLPVLFIELIRRGVILRYYIISLPFFLITFLPWIISVIHSGNSILIPVWTILNPAKVHCDFFLWLRSHGNGEYCFQYFRNTHFVLKTFAVTIFGSTGIAAVLSVTLILITILKRFRKPVKKYPLFINWLFIPAILFLTYSNNVHLHYFLIFVPLPIFIGALLFDFINERRKPRLANISYWMIIIINLFHYFSSLSSTRQ